LLQGSVYIYCRYIMSFNITRLLTVMVEVWANGARILSRTYKTW